MSDWITDRPPTEEDADSEKCVWTMCAGKVVPWGYEGIREGWPWMRTNRPEPYVKPKRFIVRKSSTGDYDVYVGNDMCYAIQLPTREAAERIAAIYEEVMP